MTMTYVGLLHSIVLGPGKRLVMADLRAMAEELDFRNARTLVATGNLIFDGDAAPPADIEARLEAAFRARFGKHVDIVLRTEDAFRRLAAKNPFPDGNAPDVGIRVMRRPLNAQTAWGFLASALFAAPGFGVLTATGQHAAVAEEVLAEMPQLAGNLMHDAHTAILMREHGVRRICTRDTDFHQFAFLEVIDPIRG